MVFYLALYELRNAAKVALWFLTFLGGHQFDSHSIQFFLNFFFNKTLFFFFFSCTWCQHR